MGLNFIGLSQKPRGFRIGLPWTAEFIILFSDSSVKALIFEVFCLFDLYGFWVFHLLGGGGDAVTICIHLKLWKGMNKENHSDRRKVFVLLQTTCTTLNTILNSLFTCGDVFWWSVCHVREAQSRKMKFLFNKLTFLHSKEVIDIFYRFFFSVLESIFH